MVRAVFPGLNAWLNALPDPRVQEMCLYTAAHLWWHIIATYLSRSTQQQWSSLRGYINPYNEALSSYLQPLHLGLDERGIAVPVPD